MGGLSQIQLQRIDFLLKRSSLLINSSFFTFHSFIWGAVEIVQDLYKLFTIALLSLAIYFHTWKYKGIPKNSEYACELGFCL